MKKLILTILCLTCLSTTAFAHTLEYACAELEKKINYRVETLHDKEFEIIWEDLFEEYLLLMEANVNNCTARSIYQDVGKRTRTK